MKQKLTLILALVLVALSPKAQSGQLLQVIPQPKVERCLSATPRCEEYRLLALSELETGNNDNSVGLAGERSRYQIMPQVWSSITQLPFASATNPFTARNVAIRIMQQRCRAYVKIWGYESNDFDWYVLWNRPAPLIGPHPTRVHITKVRERAERFANLCNKFKRQ